MEALAVFIGMSFTSCSGPQCQPQTGLSHRDRPLLSLSKKFYGLPPIACAHAPPPKIVSARDKGTKGTLGPQQSAGR